MQRPIGVILLAGAAALAGLAQVYAILVYLSILAVPMPGTLFTGAEVNEVSFQEPQWGAALWALLLAAIWFWVALGFWNLRAYAIQFGIFISLFTLIWGFFALLFGSTYEAQTIPWLLAGFIYLYLSYPGVQKHFIDNELSKLTPEQRAAIEQLEAANRAAGAKPAPGMGTTSTPTSTTPTS
jgi:hypothetical protein